MCEENKKTKFRNLSGFLKFCAIGGMIAAISFTIGFGVALIESVLIGA